MANTFPAIVNLDEANVQPDEAPVVAQHEAIVARQKAAVRRQVIINYFLAMHIPADHEDAEYFRLRQAEIRNLEHAIEEHQLHALLLDDELVDIPRPGNPGNVIPRAREQAILAEETELENLCIICFSQNSDFGLDSCNHRFCQYCLIRLRSMVVPTLCPLCRRPFTNYFAIL